MSVFEVSKLRLSTFLVVLFLPRLVFRSAAILDVKGHPFLSFFPFLVAAKRSNLGVVGFLLRFEHGSVILPILPVVGSFGFFADTHRLPLSWVKFVSFLKRAVVLFNLASDDRLGVLVLASIDVDHIDYVDEVAVVLVGLLDLEVALQTYALLE